MMVPIINSQEDPLRTQSTVNMGIVPNITSKTKDTVVAEAVFTQGEEVHIDFVDPED